VLAEIYYRDDEMGATALKQSGLDDVVNVYQKYLGEERDDGEDRYLDNGFEDY
jgi:hypothetical protein